MSAMRLNRLVSHVGHNQLLFRPSRFSRGCSFVCRLLVKSRRVR